MGEAKYYKPTSVTPLDVYPNPLAGLLSVSLIKNPIIFLYDFSFCEIRGIYAVKDTIQSVIDTNRDSCFVYDSYFRVKETVEDYAAVYRIPTERLISFEVEKESTVKINELGMLLLSYQPKKLYVFRDHENGQTAPIVNKFMAAGVDIEEITSEFTRNRVSKLAKRKSKYYKRSNENENY